MAPRSTILADYIKQKFNHTGTHSTFQVNYQGYYNQSQARGLTDNDNIYV